MTGPKVKEIDPSICTNYKLESNEKLISISIPTSKNPTGVGLVGILTVPPLSLLSEDEMLKASLKDDPDHPPTHKLALLLHGKGGHKNYCYQSILAKDLATKLGTYSFRFDFRGCGDSQENEDEDFGRKVEQDVEDIEIVLNVFTNGLNYKDININLMPNSIISHSRGSVAMFRWALKQQELLDSNKPYQFVPNLINTSGRFISSLLLEQKSPFTGSFLNQYRFGKYQEIKTKDGEIQDLGSQDLNPIKDLNEEIQVLSIYGLSDTIVPVKDSENFANLLGSRHTLKFIPFADHNFYGDSEIDESNKSKFNAENLPLKKNRVNFNYKVSSEVIDWLNTLNETDRFRNSTKIINYYPRWRDIDGISNFRDVGGWKTKDNLYIKQGLIYRCANTSNVTELGKRQIKDLQIDTIFDLRSVTEYKKRGGLYIEGVNCLNIPIYSNQDLSPQAIALHYKNLLTSWYTYKYVYRDILTVGKKAFIEFFTYLRDNPNKPIIFNCHAGKDRTGVMAMLLLLVLNVDYHTIAKEYELTTIGLIPDIDSIKRDFSCFAEQVKKSFVDIDGNPINISMDHMFDNLISSKYESMISVIQLFNDEFKGIDFYMKNDLNFTDKDIETIKSNLLTSKNPYPNYWKHRSTSSSYL